MSSANMRLPTLVYKTSKNYNNLVPILLSDDKTEIIMYPAPSDLYYNGSLALPAELKQGYLLDNRGINKNVAFINITYQDYSRLEKVPSLKELYSMIIDKDPILELYNCGKRDSFTDIVDELNMIIKKGELKKYVVNK
jgi:hypothetical protein